MEVTVCEKHCPARLSLLNHGSKPLSYANQYMTIASQSLLSENREQCHSDDYYCHFFTFSNSN